ncbi:hypothetical protein HX109_15250 [Galbibacter sp. BG1]|uniref:DUF6660 family protein n=1 Tax=Galbibacter sp. BG1 TaxID=1170699 RepID=UPI0015B9EB4F|nr:DUF6660 family protein [Galbibacter sp. BG1]QLE02856.1 hypothetical protein HX109_15250 [Galbibacter sp. BG1]
MKFIATILVFYFMALNILPCNDTVDATEDSLTVSIVDSNSDHGDDCDLCSPFCQCHCCHVHTINFKLIAFEPLQPLIPYNNFAHFDSVGKEIPLSILQPPRV